MDADVRDLAINTSATDGTKELDDGDISTETTPDAAHLQPNDTSANDYELFRDLLQAEHTRGAHDLLLVDGDAAAGERRDFGARSDNNALGIDLRLATVEQLNGDAGGGNEGRGAFDVFDAILLE